MSSSIFIRRCMTLRMSVSPLNALTPNETPCPSCTQGILQAPPQASQIIAVTLRGIIALSAIYSLLKLFMTDFMLEFATRYHTVHVLVTTAAGSSDLVHISQRVLFNIFQYLRRFGDLRVILRFGLGCSRLRARCSMVFLLLTLRFNVVKALRLDLGVVPTGKPLHTGAKLAHPIRL